MFDEPKAAGGDAGHAHFDVADRLAVANLLGAYAYTYDQDRLDEFRALFTESPELVLLHEGQVLSEDIDVVMALLTARKSAFRAERNKRRHALNSFWITSQTANDVTGHCYVQVLAIRDGGSPMPDLTGCYDFTAVKQQGVWRLDRWVITVDQLTTGLPDGRNSIKRGA